MFIFVYFLKWKFINIYVFFFLFFFPLVAPFKWTPIAIITFSKFFSLSPHQIRILYYCFFPCFFILPLFLLLSFFYQIFYTVIRRKIFGNKDNSNHKKTLKTRISNSKNQLTTCVDDGGTATVHQTNAFYSLKSNAKKLFPFLAKPMKKLIPQIEAFF